MISWAVLAIARNNLFPLHVTFNEWDFVFVQFALMFLCFFSEVRLNIYGSSRVSWDEQRAYTKGSASVLSHKSGEIFIDHTVNLLKAGRLKD